MARGSTNNKIGYVGNGVTTAFSYNFPMVKDTNSVVTVTDLSGVETTQVRGTNYSITVLSGGGVVTFVTAPTSGYKVTIRRIEAITQDSDWSNGTAVSQQTFEDAVDKLTDIAVQLQEQVDRSPKFKVSSNSLNIQFPEMVARKAIRVNDAGTGLVCSANDFDTLLQDTTAQAVIATTQATNALASATSASTSATTATAQAVISTTQATASSASATSSAGSATTATTQAGIATTQAGIATTQATTATTQATSATASATSATSSASIATTQAGIATTQAGIATTQASNATTSASNAWTSASNASVSEFNSATSASQAAASAASLSMPSLVATDYLRVNAGGTAWELRTPTQTRSDIGAAPTASPVLTGTVSIGGTAGTETLKLIPSGSGDYLVMANASGATYLYATGSSTNVENDYITKGNGSHRFFTNTYGSGVEQFRISHMASAVNYLVAYGAATSGGPQLQVQGSDSTIPMVFQAKNREFMFYTGSGSSALQISHTASSNSYVSVTGSSTNTPTLSVAGGTASRLNVGSPAISSIYALTDSATITPDFALSNDFSVTLGGNRTLANPSNLVVGQRGTFYISQDGTGSRTLVFGSYYKWTGGTAPTLSTTASALDAITYHVVSSTVIVCSWSGDFK